MSALVSILILAGCVVLTFVIIWIARVFGEIVDKGTDKLAKRITKNKDE